MRIGSTFIVGFEGTELNSELKETLLKIRPCGLIFFDTNIQTRGQVQKLIRDLRDLLGEKLIVTVDQEGGKVERLRRISPSLPSLWALGKAAGELDEHGELTERSKEYLRIHTRVLANDLLDLGFNMVLGPCADLNTNPANPIIGTRSLGTNPELARKQLEIILQTYQESGLRACLKHFPGHGATGVDSHIDLPVLDLSLEDYSRQVMPFTLDSQNLHQDNLSMLTAHIVFKHLDERFPVSLSEKVIQGELRGRLGFKGLLITDDIGSMKAVEKFGSPEEVCEQAIRAGNNIILWHTDLSAPLRAIQHIYSITLGSFFSASPEIERLIQNLYASLRLIEEFKENLPEPKSPLFLPEENFQELLSKAVEISPEAQNKLSVFWQTPDKLAVLLFDHPKLEPEVFKKVFCNSGLAGLYQFDGSKELKLDNHEKLMVFSFQAINYPAQKKFIQSLRQDFDVLQISTDLEDEGADIHLYGANKIHLEFLTAFKPLSSESNQTR